MSNETKMEKADFFELREKRLKLVYKILYVIVAVWIAVLLNLSNAEHSSTLIPAYAFLLGTTSLFIINIVKYALMEFRCMKVSGSVDESLIKQAEERYDNVWKSFSLILAMSGLLLMLHVILADQINTLFMAIILCICIIYFSVLSVVEFFKAKMGDKITKVLDIVSLFFSIITSYSACALFCMVVIK